MNKNFRMDIQILNVILFRTENDVRRMTSFSDTSFRRTKLFFVIIVKKNCRVKKIWSSRWSNLGHSRGSRVSDHGTTLCYCVTVFKINFLYDWFDAWTGVAYWWHLGWDELIFHGIIDDEMTRRTRCQIETMLHLNIHEKNSDN